MRSLLCMSPHQSINSSPSFLHFHPIAPFDTQPPKTRRSQFHIVTSGVQMPIIVFCTLEPLNQVREMPFHSLTFHRSLKRQTKAQCKFVVIVQHQKSSVCASCGRIILGRGLRSFILSKSTSLWPVTTTAKQDGWGKKVPMHCMKGHCMLHLHIN